MTATTTTTARKSAPRRPRKTTPPKTAAKQPPAADEESATSTGAEASAEQEERFVILHAEGHDWRIPRAAMDDFELLRDVRAIERGEAQRYADVLEKMLEPAELQRAMDLLRDPETGRVSLTRGYLFTQRLITANIPKS